MDRWQKTDVTGKLRAQSLLQPCARLIRHGHQSDALGKIAGAVALNFIDAGTVCKELKVSPAALNAVVEMYRQWAPPQPVRFGEKD